MLEAFGGDACDRAIRALSQSPRPESERVNMSGTDLLPMDEVRRIDKELQPRSDSGSAGTREWPSEDDIKRSVAAFYNRLGRDDRTWSDYDAMRRALLASRSRCGSSYGSA